MKNNINIFLIGNFRYTPFGGFNDIDLPYLEKNGLRITNDIQEAHILISQNRKHLKKYFYKYLNKKKYLIWTNEPRFNTHLKSEKREVFGLVNCHIMNLYTEDVFVSPLSFHGHLFDSKLETINKTIDFENKKIVGLISHFKGLEMPAVWKNGEDVDLIKKRTHIALEGHKQDVMDIYGRGWIAGVSKEDSRSGKWVSRKAEILRNYNFNLCFENTATYYYTTEKIWDSIKHYCLPIYYGKHTGIYELFPEKSFIDYSLFESPKMLFDYIENISIKEYNERLNACINTYNAICKKGEFFLKEQRELMLQAIVNKLKLINSL